jgi:hypothetical protein
LIGPPSHNKERKKGTYWRSNPDISLSFCLLSPAIRVATQLQL